MFGSFGSHCSPPFFTQSPQYFWWAIQETDDQLTLLHVHFTSSHDIVGVPTVNPLAHIQASVFFNHGVVCFVEKYVLHLSFSPHSTLSTIIHVAEHCELLVPFFAPSSHCSHSFFWTVSSPQYSWYALHVSFAPFLLEHVHSRWFQTITTSHTVNPFSHIHASVFFNHGVVFSLGKYVFHPAFEPQATHSTFLHIDEHWELLVPFFAPSSHSSSWSLSTTPSPQYFWCATQGTDNQFSFLHVHSKSSHTNFIVPTVSHSGHNPDSSFVNHGVVCFVEKYVVFQSNGPQLFATFLHVFEHWELLVPFFAPSSHSSSWFLSTTPSPHHICVALHEGEVTLDPFLQFHVYVLGVPV